MKVSVSILKEKENYLDVIEKLNNSKADYIHIDVLDNTFIKTSSFDIDDFKKVNDYIYENLNAKEWANMVLLNTYIKKLKENFCFFFQLL